MLQNVFLINGDIAEFYCPGCETTHQIRVGGKGWQFNGDYEKPTVSPSVLVRNGHYNPEHANKECWCTYEKRFNKPSPYKCIQCHSLIKEGKIQFLDDCSHNLAGTTVYLKPHN